MAPSALPPFAEEDIKPLKRRNTPSKVRLPRSIYAYKDPENVERQARTIVVCLDGTGDRFDSDNSNIVHFVSCLKKSDKNQVTYYQAGIGTYSRSGLQSGMSAAMDMAIGSELGMHVRDAYHFLMHTYKEGDKICLFGFSRGAYTARCLAGMIHKVGLLPARNIAQIPFAYDFYKDDTPHGWKMSADFKKTFCMDVNVYFIGVFDSVASVGIIPRRLPLSSTPTNRPRYFRHAMALDERRAKFKPCRYQHKDFTYLKEVLATEEKAQNGSEKAGVYRSEIEPSEPPFDSDVLEVWFAGAHADVGGGAVKNEIRHKLSDIPLRWMIRQCFECETGIIFKTLPLVENGLDVHTLWPTYEKLDVPSLEPTQAMVDEYKKGLPPRSKRAGHLIPIDHSHNDDGHYDLKIAELEEDEKNPEWYPEQVEDWFDAQAPVNDQLLQAPTWWILELLPVQYIALKAESDIWETRTGMNWGMYRGVPDKEPKMHWTVAARIKNTEYELLARYGRNAVWHKVT